MAETTPEGAISPVQSVDSGPPTVKKSFLPKISFPNPVRLFRKSPTPKVAADITPAAQATDFVPPAAAIENSTSPVDAAAPEFATPSAQVDTAALEAQKDLTAQMTAQVTASFPGARPPEMASGFAAPTNPPTETATVPPIVAEAGAVAPTLNRTETPVEAPAPTGLTEDAA